MGDFYLGCKKCRIFFKAEDVDGFLVWEFIKKHTHKRGIQFIIEYHGHANGFLNLHPEFKKLEPFEVI